MPRLFGIACLVAALAPPAGAWGIGSQLDLDGCHETITANALRDVRARLAALPRIAPTREERALIADVPFAPPDDLAGDLGGMALLLGVRDNDLKGQDPLNTFDLIRVHGNPSTQMEHCIRGPDDDGTAGNESGLAACIAFIRERATEALDGLDDTGAVDPTRRMALPIFLSIAGHVSPDLPVFYVRMGQAMHALEDGFTHAYRSADGMKVDVMLNWIDFVSASYDEPVDGPPHRIELDHCDLTDAVIQRNLMLATAAAGELLEAAADPTLSRDAKLARFDAVTAKYLTFEPGCTADNDWCAPPEAAVQLPSGCSAGGDAGPFALALVAIALGVRRRRARSLALGLAALVPVLGPAAAHADETPGVPVTPQTPADAKDAAEGKEPGRDEKTPTVTQIESVRADKRLGSPWGFAVSAGMSVDHAAGVGRIGARYRISERWIVGVDAEWNPWITTAPLTTRAGVFNGYVTGILRFPMRFDRVNLRSSLHLGVSTLLFDVYGAPKYSTGPVGAISVLGLDYDLGKSIRIVIDPAEVAVPIPEVGTIPLVYEQFRFMVGIQIAA